MAADDRRARVVSRRADPGPPEAPRTTGNRSDVTILIVDDNASKRLAIISVLRPLGHTIVEADSGEAALRRVIEQDFAVILLDVRMPGMNGLGTAALIRQRRQSELTPIIFLTAYASDEMLQADGYAEGAIDFISMPVRPDVLRAKVAYFATMHRRAEDLAAEARRVRESVDQLRTLTDTAPIGIFRTDSRDRYLYTNPRWSEITGIAPDEAMGRKWDTVVGSEQRAQLWVERAQGTAPSGEVCYRFEVRPSGSASRIVMVTSRPLLDPSGRIGGWVGTLADVTAESGAEAAMSHARDSANEASRLKSDFLANMSHEVRTPINGVLGMINLLLETDLDDRQRDYARTVRDSGRALLTLIDDILDFSTIEAGQVEMQDVDFAPRELVDGVVDLFAAVARQKGLELVVAIDEAIPALLRGDPGRIRQVLANLIGNAVKFSQTGEIAVRVTRDPDPGDDLVVRFGITDSGEGIAADKLAAIFQPFVQGDTSTSRRYGGAGLGLTICSQLVSLMGGDLSVSSRLGQGSHFWFTVRAGSVAPRRLAALASSDLGPPSPAAGNGRRLLLAEDNPINQKVAFAMLSGAGYRVDTVVNGALAVLAVASERYDAVLMDCQMPELDGFEATVAIRLQESSSRRTPIIALTAGARQEDEDACMAAGMDGYLAKPFAKAALLAKVELFVGAV
jgi:PAS domain S-box-containing protein